MIGVDKLRYESEGVLEEKNNIIDELIARLDSQEEMIAALDSSVNEYQQQYVKTSVAELQGLGYVLTKGKGKESQKFLFIEITDMKPEDSCIFSQRSTIISADKIEGAIIPSHISERIQASNNYYEQIMKELQLLKETVRVSQEKIDALTLERDQLRKTISQRYYVEPQKSQNSVNGHQKDRVAPSGDKKPASPQLQKQSSQKNKSEKDQQKPKESASKIVMNGISHAFNSDSSDEIKPYTPKKEDKLQMEPEKEEGPQYQAQVGYKTPKVTKLSFDSLFPSYSYNQSQLDKKQMSLDLPIKKQESQVEKKQPQQADNAENEGSSFLKLHQSPTQQSPKQTSPRKEKISELQLKSLKQAKKKNLLLVPQLQESAAAPPSPLVRKKNPNSKIIYIRK